jgi:pimeloyl-ACP methyl ester carboxylesterase
MFYLIGASDYNTPFELSYEYYKTVEAPLKDYIWFNRSSHSPLAEEPEKFSKTLAEKILQVEAM